MGMASPLAQNVFRALQGLSENDLISIVDGALSSQPQAREELQKTWESQPSQLQTASTAYFSKVGVHDSFNDSVLYVPTRERLLRLLSALKQNDVCSACETFPPSHTRGVWVLQLDLSGHRVGPL